MIDEVLSEAALERQHLTAIAFGCGPGSFTGVRLAAAVAQAWSLALELPVYPVSSLASLALRAAREELGDCTVCVLVRARPAEVYRAEFTWTEGVLTRRAEDQRLAASDVSLVTPPQGALILVGDGCQEVECAGFETRPSLLPSAEALLDVLEASDMQPTPLALPVYLQADQDWGTPANRARMQPPAV